MKQRLRLAKASPALLQAYENDEISLDQLMAFCLVDDQNPSGAGLRRDQGPLEQGAGRDPPYAHRENRPCGRRRALFIGAEAYKAAGGIIIRDLFDEDDGG